MPCLLSDINVANAFFQLHPAIQGFLYRFGRGHESACFV